MPGFQIEPHAGGISADAPANTYETRRKHRWVFEALGNGDTPWRANELLVLRTASRPSFKFSTADMHHNQEIVYFAGKQEWEPITLTWYDVEQNPNISGRMYDWLQSIVTLSGSNLPVKAPRQYKRTATLKMLAGNGAASEHWDMVGTWPESLNWQDLDYSASEIMTCEASMRYDRAVKIPVTPPTYV